MSVRGGPTQDPDITTYFTNIAASGSSISKSSLGSVYTFVNATKVAGLWPSLLMVAPMAGADLTAGLIKLKCTSGSSGLTNTAFVAADYQETGISGGFTPGSANASKAMSWDDVYSLNNCTMLGYVNQFNTGSDSYGLVISARGGGGGPDRMWVCQSNDATRWKILCNNEQLVPGVGTGFHGLFWMANNGGNNSQYGNWTSSGNNATLFTSNTVATGATGGGLFRSPNGSWGTVPLQFAALATFLTSGQVAQLAGYVVALQSGFNRA